MIARSSSEDASEELLRYAPRRTRQSPPVVPALDALNEPRGLAYVPTPSMAPGIGGPNLDLPLRSLRPFEGDVAIKDLRRRLALDPDLVPQPPIGERGREVPWLGRFSLVLILSALAGFGIVSLTVSRDARQHAGIAGAAPPQSVVTGAAVPLRERSAIMPLAPVRLVVESGQAFVNEPLPLGISLDDAAGGETVTLTGLVGGTRLTAGTSLGPTGWQLAARDLDKVVAHAPRDFVGAMDATVDLRSARDRLVDSKMVRLEWVPTQEARPAPSPAAASRRCSRSTSRSSPR